MGGGNFNVTETSKLYTFEEACEHMRQLNNQPTTKTVQWYYAATGKRVAIGVGH